MSKKTAMNELKDLLKERIPSAGTDQERLTKQKEFSWLVYEIGKEMLPKETAQLRDAFNKGVVYGMLLSTSKNEDLHGGFDQYYRDKYGDEA